MSIAAILPMLIPLISSFIKGRSGDDLAGMLTSNQGNLASILENFNMGGASSLPAGLGGADPNATLATLMPLLMKQQPVFVVPDGMNAITPRDPKGLNTEKFQTIDMGSQEEIKAKLAELEKKFRDMHGDEDE